MTPVHDGWHAVGLVDGLDIGTATGTRLFGRELVVWRDGAGRSHVWEDRCPHRGMRLSFGFVRANDIACLYHGWHFGADGRCSRIPAHPELKPPATMHATTLCSAEQLGMVWVHTGSPAGVPPGVEAATVPVRSIAMSAPAGAVAAALALIPFDDWGLPQVEQRGPLLVLNAAGHRVLAAVQTVSLTETTLHLAIEGAAQTYCGAGQARVSAWAEALRRAVE